MKYDEEDDKVIKKPTRKVKKTHQESSYDALVEQNLARKLAGLDEIDIGKERKCNKCDKLFISLRGERCCGCLKSRYVTSINGQQII